MVERETECRLCGAPEGEYITRDKTDPLRWSMDRDLFCRRPWGAPVRVLIVQSSGLCRKCHGRAA